jgi:DNA primase
MANPNKSLEYRHALNYLKKRNITRDDILRYNIGYCETGLYRNRIIIPSYDKDASINFFSARDFLNTSNYKYLLPPWSKDIIGFELFINFQEPIVLVEGSFDAISIRNNVIPLFGKIMSNALKEAILENDVKRVNICLDNDAIKDSLKIVDYLTPFGIDVRLIQMKDKDPSIIGFADMSIAINTSKMMDFADVFLMKMNS